jgi:hypothetical protein
MIMYSSGARNIEINNPPVAAVVKYLALGLNKIAFRSLLKIPEAFLLAKKEIFGVMNNEIQHVSAVAGNSVLKKTSPEELASFKLETLSEELSVKTPVTLEMLKLLCSTKNTDVQVKGSELSHHEGKVRWPIRVTTQNNFENTNQF